LNRSPDRWDTRQRTHVCGTSSHWLPALAQRAPAHTSPFLQGSGR